MIVKLSDQIEKIVLRAMIEGVLRPNVIDDKELSDVGRSVRAGIERLLKEQEPPLKLEGLFFNCVNIEGVPQEELAPYFRALRSLPTGPEMDTLVRTFRDKKVLTELIQEAGDQLSKDKFEMAGLTKILDRHLDLVQPLVTLSELVGEDLAEPPKGLPLAGLPKITGATGGLHGYWVIGGEPGLGKSTLAWQIALEATSIPVLYYDLDATGLSWLAYRTMAMASNSRDRFLDLAGHVYLRTSIRSLEDDARTVGSGLIVIDSIQTLPVWKDRRQSLDWWLARFKDYVHRGFTVLCISEKSRDAYGKTDLSSFKETGAIEYACSMGAVLKGDPANPDSPLDFYVVKNRHHQFRGNAATLVRDRSKGSWAFTEQDVTGGLPG